MSKTSSVVSLIGALSALAMPIAALWVWGVPALVSPSTFAFVVAFVIGGVTVTLVTWRNAQATATVAQLLEATEAGDAQVAIVSAGTRPRSK